MTSVKFSVVFVFVAILILAGSQSVRSFSGNPPEVLLSVVKNKNISTCNSCHGTGKMGSFPETGGISIDYEGDEMYESNKTYNVSVTIDTARNRHGFQMISLDNMNQSIGIFTIGNANQKVQEDALDNVSHISHNNIPNTNAATFSFTWQSPSTYTDTIRFYVIAVAADGNKQNTNDKVYYSSKKISHQALGYAHSLHENETRIYPTLVEDCFTIQAGRGEILTQIEIVDVRGKSVFFSAPNSEVTEIKRGLSMPSGWYVVQVKNGLGTSYHRIYLR